MPEICPTSVEPLSCEIIANNAVDEMPMPMDCFNVSPCFKMTREAMAITAGIVEKISAAMPDDTLSSPYIINENGIAK